MALIVYNFIGKMYTREAVSPSLQVSTPPPTSKSRGSNNEQQQQRKSVGYGHIRMRSNISGSYKVKSKQEKAEYSQLANKMLRSYQKSKQKIISFNFDQKNFAEKIHQRLTLKPIKRTNSSFENICATRKENSQIFAAPRPKAITFIDAAQCDMESICSKMTESIIMTSDTVESLADRAPTLSNGSFERIKFLGQGKFGQVHLVKHKESGFICALKIISKQVVRSEGVQSQIAKQIRIHNQLRCLNIIDFYGFFSDDKNFYMLLEYATEGSAFGKLKGKSRLEEREVQPIAKGVCEGLRFMHRMGFIHRDIKPQNIVFQFGVPKICDFGWATDCGSAELCKSYCGTPLYLSPEMIKKQFYGTSVDVWAMGLVIYELLVGRVPFPIWSQEDMSQILTKPIKFPEYIDRSYKCEQFIRGCLEKQTYMRMELGEALHHPFLHEDNEPKQLSYSFLEITNRILSRSV